MGPAFGLRGRRAFCVPGQTRTEIAAIAGSEILLASGLSILCGVDGALCSWAPAADEPTIDGQPQPDSWKGAVAEVKPLQVAPPPLCDNMCNRLIAAALDRRRAPTETPERADDGR